MKIKSVTFKSPLQAPGMGLSADLTIYPAKQKGVRIEMLLEERAIYVSRNGVTALVPFENLAFCILAGPEDTENEYSEAA